MITILEENGFSEEEARIFMAFVIDYGTMCMELVLADAMEGARK
jgi:hypothetical protein